MKTIKSLQNSLVKHYVKLRKSRDYRYRQKRFLIEGVNTAKEILRDKKDDVLSYMTADSFFFKEFPSENGYLITETILKKISGVKSPEGVVLELKMPKACKLKGKKILGLDRVRDPGNMGTLIRTALAFGWKEVFLIGDCCDPFNEKAVRASKGAIVYVNIYRGSEKEFLDVYKGNIYAADMKGEPFFSIDKPDVLSLVLGSESHGVSDTILKQAKTISIPIDKKVDSLNVAVAGGILMNAFGGYCERL